VLTGDMFGAAEAHRVGVVNRLFAPAELAEARRSSRRRCSPRARALRLALEAIQRGARCAVEGERMECDMFALAATTRTCARGWPRSSRSASRASEPLNPQEDETNMAKDIVIVGGARTPMCEYSGTPGYGKLKDVSAIDLAAHASKAAIERARIDPESIEHVVVGNACRPRRRHLRRAPRGPQGGHRRPHAGPDRQPPVRLGHPVAGQRRAAHAAGRAETVLAGAWRT
jgi:hypothetical protein